MPLSSGQFGSSTAPSLPSSGLSHYGIPAMGAVPQPGFVPQPGNFHTGGESPYRPVQQAMPPQEAPMPQQPMGAPPQGGPNPMAYGENRFGVMPHVGLEDMANYLINSHSGVETKGVSNPYSVRTNVANSDASGKYQYTKPTWNNYGGYPEARYAPPEVQEKRMREDVMARLQQYGGDPYKAAAHHYYPAYAADPTKWDSPITANGKPNGRVIVDQNGRPRPTVRQYLQHMFPSELLNRYHSQYSSPGDVGVQSG